MMLASARELVHCSVRSAPSPKRWPERNVGSAMEPIATCSSLSEYQDLLAFTIDQQREMALYEADLDDGSERFTVPGYCEICDAQSTFLVNHNYSWFENGRRVLNWREHLTCHACGLNNRMRASLKLLTTLSQGGAVYLTEQATPLFTITSRFLKQLHGSEFLRDGTARGSTNQAGFRHEDVTCLTFPDESFDSVATFDVLEHVPQYQRAIAEFFRCLRPGGCLLISVPFTLTSASTVTRAIVQPDGSIKHLLPPEYHDDPLDRAGVLCFHNFGWDFLEQLRCAGFSDAKISFYWSKQFAYLGGLQFLISANKSPTRASLRGGSIPTIQDLTKDYNYALLLEEEKAQFDKIDITRDLKTGGVHANSAWTFYWRLVWQVINDNGFGNLSEYICKNFPAENRPIEVLSLASGYCGHELDLARGMTRSYRITCTDLNETMFEKAKDVAEQEGLSIEFLEDDLNFTRIAPGRYDLIFAHAAIHHVINLEHLFEQISAGLSPTGILHLTEVIGKNRKLIWDRNERYANALLDLLPERLTRGIRLAVHETDADGMEGIRQEEIYPLLRKHFVALFEHRHGAFMRFICTHPDLGPAFDVNDIEARRHLEFLIANDNCAVRYGVLAPLEIWGLYRPLNHRSVITNEGFEDKPIRAVT
jgi:2-polyprenyl-3-methyl-5-hydroxy-6-metoxy-1,4-benzoquinol methylase